MPSTTAAVVAAATPTWVTLELTTTSLGNTNNNNESSPFTIRKIELNNNETQNNTIRFIVTLPNQSLDIDEVHLIIALITEQFDLLQQTNDTNGGGSSNNNRNIPNEGGGNGGGGGDNGKNGSVVIIMERLKMQSVQFTPDGIKVMNQFISAHASTIKHISLKDMINVNSNHHNNNDVPISSLELIIASIVQYNIRIEVLNLSDNMIPYGIWKYLCSQVSLRQLILDYVIMDDDCLLNMSLNFTNIGYSLEELYVVLLNIPASLSSHHSSNHIIRQCYTLSSLRWAIKQDNSTNTSHAKLPWIGLADMCHNIISIQHPNHKTATRQQSQSWPRRDSNNRNSSSSNNNTHPPKSPTKQQSRHDDDKIDIDEKEEDRPPQQQQHHPSSSGTVGLLHLVMDGGTIGIDAMAAPPSSSSGSPPQPQQIPTGGGETHHPYTSEIDCLCIALSYMTELRSMKMRSIGLRDDGIIKMGQAFLQSSPPLESIDISRNHIQSNGVKNFVDIIINGNDSNNNNIIKHIQTMIFDKNYIDQNGCRIIHEMMSYYSNNPKLDIKMELQNPPIPYHKVCYNIAFRKSQLEKDYNALYQDHVALKQQKQDHPDHSGNVNNSSNNKNNNSNNNAAITALNETIRILQEEVAALTEERNTLVKAFSLVNSGGGSTKQQQQQQQSDILATAALLERISFLENAISNNNNSSSNTNNLDMYRTPVTARSSYALPTSRTNNNNNSGGDPHHHHAPPMVSRGLHRTTSQEMPPAQRTNSNSAIRTSPKHSTMQQPYQQQQADPYYHHMIEPNNNNPNSNRRASHNTAIVTTPHGSSPSPRRRDTIGTPTPRHNSSGNINNNNPNSRIMETPVQRSTSRDPSERWNSSSPSYMNTTPNSNSSGSGNSANNANNNTSRRKTYNNQTMKQQQQQQRSVDGNYNQDTMESDINNNNMNPTGVGPPRYTNNRDHYRGDTSNTNTSNNSNRQYPQQPHYMRSNSGGMDDSMNEYNNSHHNMGNTGSGHR